MNKPASLNAISKIHGTSDGGIWINEKYHGHEYGIEAFNISKIK